MIGIVGLGFVGGSALKSFSLKKVDVVGYDKYKDGGIGSIDEILKTSICFLCLPTLFKEDINAYDKTAIHEVCTILADKKYNGIVVIKSTVEPETTISLHTTYPSLLFAHNPEFLTARTAFEDFHTQSHIVIGLVESLEHKTKHALNSFYATYYPDAERSFCSSTESESMKIMCNSFYASKIMLFNEYYLMCKKNGTDFNKIRDLMLKNNWINPMHTTIPGPDGKLGYGGACFPKDTQALRSYINSKGSKCIVLQAVIDECNDIREE